MVPKNYLNQFYRGMEINQGIWDNTSLSILINSKIQEFPTKSPENMLFTIKEGTFFSADLIASRRQNEENYSCDI